MNKFDKARFHVDLVEAASKAAIDAVWCKIRYDSTYFDYDDSECPDWYDDEWLETHMNEAGREYLKVAKEFAEKIEGLL